MEKKKILNDLITRYPVLNACRDSITQAAALLIDCYENNKKLLVCGNGGSAADSSHIVGELMKGFLKKREISRELRQQLASVDAARGEHLGIKLQGALPAISLSSHNSLISAVLNDMEGSLVFAQQVIGYGQEGDVLLGISTSGNAEDVINAAVAAKAKGMKVIGLSGSSGGKLKKFCDIMISVPSDSVPLVQELHLPVYHALCAVIEEHFYR